MSKVSEVYLSLGSNIGNRKENLESAIDYLDSEANIRVIKKSSIYETEPVGGVEQDNFYNCIVLIETTLLPYELLDRIHDIETALHRKRIVKWGPRTIDIDIIFYDNIKINDKLLVIPHKEMESRMFVLMPLIEILEEDTDLYKYVKDLIDKCDKSKAVNKLRCEGLEKWMKNKNE